MDTGRPANWALRRRPILPRPGIGTGMGHIIVSENITLDGAAQDPTGEEGHASGGWFGRAGEADRAAFAETLAKEADNAEALLLGRRSYAWFAERWAQRPGAWADRLRALPKYVVASSRPEPGWGDTTVVTLDEIADLRARIGGELVVYASAQLVRALLERDLVDGYRMAVHPVFAAVAPARPMRLEEARGAGEGLTFLTYRRADQP
jgi:dihydrofolate reductase